MRAELLNAFIVASGQVIASELNVRVTRGTLSLKQDAYITNDVTVLISLVGDVAGIVIVSMDYEIAKAFISRMLDEQIAEFNELAQSGIGELGNVVAGRASTKLGELGLMANISVPTLIVGKGSSISTLGISRLTVPLETDLGKLQLDLALRESNTGPSHISLWRKGEKEG